MCDNNKANSMENIKNIYKVPEELCATGFTTPKCDKKSYCDKMEKSFNAPKKCRNPINTDSNFIDSPNNLPSNIQPLNYHDIDAKLITDLRKKYAKNQIKIYKYKYLHEDAPPVKKIIDNIGLHKQPFAIGNVLPTREILDAKICRLRMENNFILSYMCEINKRSRDFNKKFCKAMIGENKL